MTLLNVPDKQVAIITVVQNPNLVYRGFMPSTPIKVLSKNPFLVEVGDSRWGIDIATAKEIIVELQE